MLFPAHDEARQLKRVLSAEDCSVTKGKVEWLQ